MKAPRVVVIVKRSTYVSARSDGRVRELLANGHPTVARIKRAHEDHRRTVEEVRVALDALGVRATFVEPSRKSVARPPWRGRPDLVVTVGGDGTLLAASHWVGSQTPVLGINSAPHDSVGFFCGARGGRARRALAAALAGELPRIALTRMRVEKNGEVLHDRVLNEVLICHTSPAATSRYILRLDDGRGRQVEEEQKSSGLWVGPAAGSTAAQRSAGGRVLPLTARSLQYVVREAYTPWGRRLRLRRGLVSPDGWLEVLSKMRAARVFADGVHIVFDCALGDAITLRRSPEPLTVLGLSKRRGRA